MMAQAQDPMGRWQNDLGSVLEITSVANDGTIRGKYASSSGVDGRTFPLQGWINGVGQDRGKGHFVFSTLARSRQDQEGLASY